jgi:hypothetical protein
MRISWSKFESMVKLNPGSLLVCSTCSVIIVGCRSAHSKIAAILVWILTSFAPMRSTQSGNRPMSPSKTTMWVKSLGLMLLLLGGRSCGLLLLLLRDCGLCSGQLGQR